MQHESLQKDEKKDRHMDGLLKEKATAASVYLLCQRFLQVIKYLALHSPGLLAGLQAQLFHYADRQAKRDKFILDFVFHGVP